MSDSSENFHINLSAMDDEELDRLKFFIKQEQEKRTEERRQKAWSELALHIINYTQEFGSIRVEDHSQFVIVGSQSTSFPEIGKIKVTYR